MSGAEVKAQVMEALWDTSNALVPGTLESSRAEAAAALSDCVVLTREEQDKITDILGELEEDGCVEFSKPEDISEALALLTPEPKEEP